MPVSLSHEILVELFRNRPLLAAELLAAVGNVRLPRRPRATVENSELNEIKPAEYAADAVIHLRGGGSALDVIVEIQRRRSALKRWTWPAYLAVRRARTRRDVVLLVLALDRGTARWAARPIPLGHPGWVLTPLVIGPDAVPLVTQAAAARRSPELAVLSTLVHGQGSDGLAVARAAVAGLQRLDEPKAKLYLDVILNALGRTDRSSLERHVIENYTVRSPLIRRLMKEGEREGLQKGIEKGERRLLLRQLRRRFGALPPWAEERVELAPLEQVEAWADALLTATSLDEVFAA